MQTRTRRHIWLALAGLFPVWLLGQTPAAERSFSIPAKGAFSVVTAAPPGSLLSVGYSTLSSANELTGLAVFGFRQGGVLVTEAAVPMSRSYHSGRFYARVDGNVNTGIAIANPNAAQNLQYDLSDSEGRQVASGSLSIPAGAQMASFLNEPPFNVAAPFEGTLAFTSPSEIFVTPLRGFTNERGEFLITTLSVIDSSTFSSGYVIPHFADGGGWTTQLLLVNPTATTETGLVIWTDPSGLPRTVTVNGQTASVFPFSVPPRGVARLQTAGDGTGTSTGVVSVFGTPAGPGRPVSLSPMVTVIFSYRRNGITVTETGASPSLPGADAKTAYLYGEAIGNLRNPSELPRQTGLAIFNARSAGAIPITIELTRLDGSLAGTASLTFQSGEQKSLFLTEIPGLESLPLPFQGMVQIRAPATDALYAVGLHGTYNERGDFLLSSTPTILVDPRLPVFPAFWSGRAFPHFALGGGYTSQFVLFSSQFIDGNGQPGPPVSGTLRFFRQDGGAAALPLQ